MSDTPQNSDFMKRLEALKAGKQADNKPIQPSLKERLQRSGGLGAQPPDKAADIRARIQSRFDKSTAPTTAQRGIASSLPAPESAPAEIPQFETADLPQVEAKKTDSTQSWTPENGGVCPSCGTFNLAFVAFCGECSYMLVRSEVVVEVTTAYSLKEMKGLAHTFVDKLARLKIHTTEDLLRVGLSRRNRQSLIQNIGMSERSLLRLLHQADLCRIPAVTPEHVAMLELLGITSLEGFLKQKPLELYKQIQQAKIKLNQQGILFLPTKTQVGQWFDEAQQLPKLQIV